MNGFSYEALAFHLEDSNTFRSFCRLGLMDETPSKATLQRNIKKVRAETLEALNTALVKRAEDEGLESCRKVRTDCTVTETHIHEPSDSSLLWDGVRVLVRLVRSGQEFVEFPFTDHSRRAKRRMIGIVHCARNQERVPLYQDLVKVTEKTVSAAERLLEALCSVSLTTSAQIVRVEILCSELRTVLELVRRVIEQTRRRVFQNESVPATEKVVSLFEPHTDIIVKDRRNTYYGHKLCVTSGGSGLVLDCVVEQGNPADSQLAVDMITRLKGIYGHTPEQVSFDGGFASKDNLNNLKALGVKDVAFSKKRGLEILDMVRNTSVYRKLKHFRAGIESTFSWLKRSFGLNRCNWSGFASFNAYVWTSIVASNLVLLARLLS